MILALDIGSSSVRAALYDANADPIPNASAKIERTLTFTPDGGAEIDADEALAQAVAAIDAVLEKTSELKDPIDFVAASSFWHSLVGVDERGKPTTKVFGWADTRSRKSIDVLRKKFDESEIHNRTGARFHSSFWPAKISWLRKENAGVFAKTAQWLSLSDYLCLKLFGEATTSVSMASGTGIFDIRKCDWDRELCAYLKIKPANLPAIVYADNTSFHLKKTFATRWPPLANAKWFPAIADGAADNIGAGCLTSARAALMVGTSGAMRVAYTGEPPVNIPGGLWCYRIDRKRVIIGGALSDGGGLYQWATSNLKMPDDAETQIARRLPGSHGLAFLPFLAGERSTGYHESATGAVLGLRSSTSAVDILHAALEAVSFRFGEIFRQLNSIVKIKEIVASGGALREAPLWTQMIADVLGRDLFMNDVSESSSQGAVLLALESIGNITSIEKMPISTSVVIRHDKAKQKIYRPYRDRHENFYKLLL